jgi:hypothetical protein
VLDDACAGHERGITLAAGSIAQVGRDPARGVIQAISVIAGK